MLFEPDRHEPLRDSRWDAAQAQEAIRAIVADLEQSLRGDDGWPVHPLDVSPDEPPTWHKTLYLGAAGTLWAMWYLERAGAVRLSIDPGALIGPVYASYLAAPDTGSVVPSYYLGEVGILLVLWRLTGSTAAADRIAACIRENIPNPTNEALWAAPGTMVGALHMHRWTGEARWRELFVENAEQLWRTWVPSADAPCHLWIQDLYGHVGQLLGAGHGFAGNAYPLLRGASMLSDERRRQTQDRCVETLRVTAITDGDGMNWPPGLGAPRPGRTKTLMQWCHGAPGIVTGLADFPRGASAEMDAMLVKAGNAVWRAGPLAKGHGICHGTAGNGYALLALHHRTGDPVWLERARAFAMHAIGQQARMREQYGRGRHGLWTGDPGLAVYLWHCLQGAHGLPGLDVLD